MKQGKGKSKCILILLFAASLLGAFAACGEGEKKTQLSVPENLRMEDEVLHWDEVAGATQYLVYFGEKGQYTSDPQFDTFGLITEEGSYPIEVIALGDDESTIESDPAVFEYTVTYQGFMYRETADGGYEITANPEDPPRGFLLIPETIDGTPVTGIVDKGFIHCTGITAAILPDSINDLGFSVFYGCTSLKRVKLPSYLSTIPINMFADCTSLWDFSFPAGVEKISAAAFLNCSSLKELIIPASATELLGSPWKGNRLERIEVEEGNSVYYSEGNCVVTRAEKKLVLGCAASAIPDDVVSIGNMAFARAGIEGIEIPESVKTIDAFAFLGNPMKNFVLPAGVTGFEARILEGCDLESLSVAEGNKTFYGEGNCVITRDTNTIALGCNNSVIPSVAERIGPSAFAACEGLKEIAVPSNIKEIGDSAFADCKNLRRIYLSDGLKRIGESAFQYCWSLDGIAIPESVTEIVSGAFYMSGAMLYMACDRESKPSGWDADFMKDGICEYFYGCNLAYDEEGYCYVVSTDKLLITGSGADLSFSMSIEPKAPCRRGYVFAGWAIESGGEIVFDAEIFTGILTEITTHHQQEAEYTYTAFGEGPSIDDFREIEGKTLYAVWVPNN